MFMQYRVEYEEYQEKPGKCVKGEAFLFLKCKLELRNLVLDITVHFLAICHDVKEKS